MTNKWIALLLFLMSPIFVMGCKSSTSTDTTDTSYYYDPQIPGGTIGNSTSLSTGIKNFAADNTQLNQITLTWTIPTSYSTMTYSVYIYKKAADATFVLPDPTQSSNAAYLYLLQSIPSSAGKSSLLDSASLTLPDQSIAQAGTFENNTYTYWAYLKVTVNGVDKWSPGVSLTVTSKTPEDSFVFPDVATFWNNYTYTLGASPYTGTDSSSAAININTFSTDATFPAARAGSIALGYSGNVMYYADTKSNRVVIYTRGLAYSCAQYKDSDPATYYACIYQYSGLTLSAFNVLGQTTSTDSSTCQQKDQSICQSATTQSTCETSTSSQDMTMCTWATTTSQPNGFCSAYQKCLTAPTKVTVSNDQLFISDSGNNRIINYSSLPVKGCIKEITPGYPKAIDCNPTLQIGKKSFYDTNTYAIGKSSLNQPGGVTILGSDLYIADTGNNRVVKIKNFADPTSFSCTKDDQWGNLQTDSGYTSGKCKFTGLLGQPDYFTSFSLKDTILCSTTSGGAQECNSSRVLAVNSDGSETIHDTMDSTLFNRYFHAPLEVRFTDAGKLLVSANEDFSVTSKLGGTSELRGRILVWNTNPMSDLAAADATKCTAGWYTKTDTNNNFETSNLCRANSVIGQDQTFTKLINVGQGADYESLIVPYALKSVDAFDLRGNSIFAVSRLNNKIYYWKDFVASYAADGNAPTSKVGNPNGALDSTSGRYLPTLVNISDIKVSNDNNLIYVSDPGQSHVYEIRAYSY